MSTLFDTLIFLVNKMVESDTQLHLDVLMPTNREGWIPFATQTHHSSLTSKQNDYEVEHRIREAHLFIRRHRIVSWQIIRIDAADQQPLPMIKQMDKRRVEPKMASPTRLQMNILSSFQNFRFQTFSKCINSIFKCIYRLPWAVIWIVYSPVVTAVMG